MPASTSLIYVGILTDVMSDEPKDRIIDDAGKPDDMGKIDGDTVEPDVSPVSGDTKDIEETTEQAGKSPDQKSQPNRKQRNNRGMYAALLASVGVAAFFAGLSMPVLNQDPITMNDLDDAIKLLEDKIDTLATDLQDLEDVMLTDPNTGAAQEPVIVTADDDPVLGSADAPIVIIEFSDFQCPFCAKFHAETLPLIKENYIDTGKVKLVYRDFPIQNIHPNAMAAAVAAECADEQGMFWDYHDTLFESMNQWKDLSMVDVIDQFKAYAMNTGTDETEFADCMDTGKYVNEVASDYADGVSYGITGTPAFFLGNDQIGYHHMSGAKPYDEFQFVIEQLLSFVES